MDVTQKNTNLHDQPLGPRERACSTAPQQETSLPCFYSSPTKGTDSKDNIRSIWSLGLNHFINMNGTECEFNGIVFKQSKLHNIVL